MKHVLDWNLPVPQAVASPLSEALLLQSSGNHRHWVRWCAVVILAIPAATVIVAIWMTTVLLFSP